MRSGFLSVDALQLTSPPMGLFSSSFRSGETQSSAAKSSVCLQYSIPSCFVACDVTNKQKKLAALCTLVCIPCCRKVICICFIANITVGYGTEIQKSPVYRVHRRQTHENNGALRSRFPLLIKPERDRMSTRFLFAILRDRI